MPIQIKRLFAGIIDHSIICFISSSLVLAVTLGKMNISILSLTTFFLSFVIQLMFKDFIFFDASIGKKLLKIKVVTMSDSGETSPFNLSFINSIKRTMPLILLPLELCLIIFNNKRIGDLLANTSVVTK